jgi:hypothetical protein
MKDKVFAHMIPKNLNNSFFPETRIVIRELTPKIRVQKIILE